MKTYFSTDSEHKLPNGVTVKMHLIGQWSDICAYYAGSDGNAWTFNLAVGRSWANDGPLADFRSNFSDRFRGDLFVQ